MTRRAGDSERASVLTRPAAKHRAEVALLTGGLNKPYVYGLATALASKGIHLHLIAGEALDRPEFHRTPEVTFLNLRGNQQPQASLINKALRVLVYYDRLVRYAPSASPRIFHILWNNKFEVVDRTLLTLYYKLLGKKVVLTVHNVNAGWRDSSDSALNRVTLKIQYRLADHLFVHTEKMKQELIRSFCVDESLVTVIPFGIYNSVPATAMTPVQAKQRLGVREDERTLLFFGNITPYKGLEYLAAAFEQLVRERDDYRLIIAGKPKNAERYWQAVSKTISGIARARVIQKIEYIPDQDIELYFKAADVLILPYTRIFQSAVLFLGYNFGLPAIAADVGSLSEDIIEGETGFVFSPRDSNDLARAINRYFTSELFMDLQHGRQQIHDYAAERHSWDTVAQMTRVVYAELLGGKLAGANS